MTQEINHELGSVNVYHYDAGGNLSYCNSGLYDPNHITQLWKDKAYTYGDTNWKDKLTAYNGKAITYDEIGNPLTYDGWAYTWEAGRQLKKQEKGTTSIEYTYDENGLRTQKKTTENGKTTVYDYVWKGDRLIGLTIDAGISIEYLYFFYNEDGKAAGFVHDNTDVYFYQLDAQGNVNALVKQDGTTAAEYTYDAWGNLLSSKGEMANINPLTYRGYQYDHDTGLYYLQSRYYNPEWGRFINADMEIMKNQVFGANLFAYCNGNPVMNIDRTGESAKTNLGTLGSMFAFEYFCYLSGNTPYVHINDIRMISYSLLGEFYISKLAATTINFCVNESISGIISALSIILEGFAGIASTVLMVTTFISSNFLGRYLLSLVKSYTIPSFTKGTYRIHSIYMEGYRGDYRYASCYIFIEDPHKQIWPQIFVNTTSIQ